MLKEIRQAIVLILKSDDTKQNHHSSITTDYEVPSTYTSVDSLTVLSMPMYSTNTASDKYWNTHLQDAEDFSTKFYG